MAVAPHAWRHPRSSSDPILPPMGGGRYRCLVRAPSPAKGAPAAAAGRELEAAYQALGGGRARLELQWLQGKSGSASGIGAQHAGWNCNGCKGRVAARPGWELGPH